MSTDLFGKPLTPSAPFVLSTQQKRQATLLHYWMSEDYLKGLIAQAKSTIQYLDQLLGLADRQGRDALMTDSRWGVRDTPLNWSTHVYPAFVEYHLVLIEQLALRSSEVYERTGINEVGRMLSEFSSRWMAPEEQKDFDARYSDMEKLAYRVDDVVRRRPKLSTLCWQWQERKALFDRFPKFVVRTDIEVQSGDMPPHTGVYVPADDPYGALQFAWVGNPDGALADVETLNPVGLKAVSALGVEGAWEQTSQVSAFATEAFNRGDLPGGMYGASLESTMDPKRAPYCLSRFAFESRPCRWYYVELLDGEFDEELPSHSDDRSRGTRLRCESGQPCPRSGYWITPAQVGSRRHFQAGDVMPSLGGDYGVTVWQWDDNQQP